MEKFKCARCGRCCSHYWIMVMPEEAKSISKHLKIPLREFVEDYCFLYLDLFPSSAGSRVMHITSEILPKNVFNSLEKLLTIVPSNFLALPSLMLRREGKKCVFYDEKSSACAIHALRPLPCRLFPFLSLEEDIKGRKWSEIYGFCKGLQECSPSHKNLFSDYYPLAESYFKEVKEKGIRKLWPSLPKKGIVCYKGIKLCEISLEEYLSIIGKINE